MDSEAASFATLPWDILTPTIALTIFGVQKYETEETRAQRAVRLSHICRAVRDIILSTPDFWSEIESVPRQPAVELAQACIERSGQAPLDLIIPVYTHMGTECDEVFLVVLPHVHRWRSLHLEFVNAEGFAGFTGALERAQHLYLPALESLSEIRHDASLAVCRSMSFYRSWKMPKVLNLRLVDTLPIYFPNLQTITSFSFTLHDFYVGPVPFVELVEVLPFLLALRNLEIRVGHGMDFPGDNFNAFENIIFGHVKTLHIHFVNYKVDFSVGSPTIRKFFSLLHFPIVEEVWIHYDVRQHLSGIVADDRPFLRFISEQFRFPSLRHVHVEVISSDSIETTSSRYFAELPTDLPPNLESLSFFSNLRLLASERDDEATETSNNQENNFPRIQSVTFNIVHHKPEDSLALKRWAQRLTDRLRLSDRLDTFRGLRFHEKDCDYKPVGPSWGAEITLSDLGSWRESGITMAHEFVAGLQETN